MGTSTRQPGYTFSSHVPPTSPFFSNTVTATPAWRRRCAAARPEAPGADDRAAKPASEVGGAPRGSAQVGAFERQLLAQERIPGLGRAGADQESEDTPAFLRRQLMVRTTRAQVIRQGGHRQRTCLGHLPGTEAAPGHEELRLVRRELLPEQGKVARPVRYRAEQLGHVRRGAGFCDVPTHAEEPTQTRVPPGGQRPMCLPSSAIWLFTSTVRGNVSMAAARLSAVQRSSVSTDSAIDQPA